MTLFAGGGCEIQLLDLRQLSVRLLCCKLTDCICRFNLPRCSDRKAHALGPTGGRPRVPQIHGRSNAQVLHQRSPNVRVFASNNNNSNIRICILP